LVAFWEDAGRSQVFLTGAAATTWFLGRWLALAFYYGIPEVLGAHRARYAGRRALVVGSGHSAFTVLLDLVALAERAPDTRTLWAIRRDELGTLFGGGQADALPERGRLGQRLRALVELGTLTIARGFRLDRLTRTEQGIVAAHGESVGIMNGVWRGGGHRRSWRGAWRP